MNLDKKDKRTLDAIGRALIARDVMPATEIDRIVSNPHLFAGIRARRSEAIATGRLAFVRYSASFAAIIFLLIAMGASLALFRSKQEVASGPQAQAPAGMPATAARPDNLPPQLVGSDPSQGRAVFRSPAAERVMPKAAVYSAPAKRRAQTEFREPAPEFYPIAYSGDPGETGGSHIIRVDIPRSRLFALGVNVPLENDSDTVKADLLVGADGVPRAIRVIK